MAGTWPAQCGDRVCDLPRPLATGRETAARDHGSRGHGGTFVFEGVERNVKATARQHMLRAAVTWRPTRTTTRSFVPAPAGVAVAAAGGPDRPTPCASVLEALLGDRAPAAKRVGEAASAALVQGARLVAASVRLPVQTAAPHGKRMVRIRLDAHLGVSTKPTTLLAHTRAAVLGVWACGREEQGHRGRHALALRSPHDQRSGQEQTSRPRRTPTACHGGAQLSEESRLQPNYQIQIT